MTSQLSMNSHLVQLPLSVLKDILNKLSDSLDTQQSLFENLVERAAYAICHASPCIHFSADEFVPDEFAVIESLVNDHSQNHNVQAGAAKV